MAASGEASGGVLKELAERDPEFDDDGDEFQDVDVIQEWVDINFAILGIVEAAGLVHAASDQVKDGDAPHVVEFVLTTPTTETIGTSIGGQGDGGIARDDEANGATPSRCVPFDGDTAT